MTNRWIAILPGLVAALALLTGCGGSSNGSAEGHQTAASPAVTDASPPATHASPTVTGGNPGTETAGTLATEQGGTESAGPTQDGQVSISVARLPMGGNGGNRDDSEQCVSVSYLGDDKDQDLRIPDGFRITVTGGAFALSPDQFEGDLPDKAPVEIGGSACASQDILCLSGFSFTAQNDEANVSCFIPVRATRGPVDGGNGEFRDVDVELTVEGVLDCPGRPRAECEAFGSAASAVADPIRFSVPFVVTSSSSSSSSSSASQSAGDTSTSPS